MEIYRHWIRPPGCPEDFGCLAAVRGSPPQGSTLPLPVAVWTPNGSKASLSCQGLFGKWCRPIRNGYSFLLLYGGLRCTGICVSPTWLCGPLVCTQSRARAAVSFPLHANELSCSGSSKAGRGGSAAGCGRPQKLATASPKGQREAPAWKLALPCSVSRSCNPPMWQQG